MGTRSLTFIYSEDRSPVVCMYRQFDGYPSGHGAELATFLSQGKLVNGLGSNDANVFNGMECLAAQMVARFKTEPGGFYLVSTDGPFEEFNYLVTSTPDGFLIEVLDCNEERLFSGSLDNFTAWCKED